MAEAAVQQIRELRQRLDHPVVDADGHLIEHLPGLWQTVQKVGGSEAAVALRARLREDPLTSMGSPGRGEQRGVWWGVTNEARDLATVTAPGLLAARMDELGLDFAVLYPTVGLTFPTLPDSELRRLACRALNTANAELCGPYADRLTPAAVIPMHTPEEAIGELRHAVNELGLKVAAIPPGVARPWPDLPPGAFPTAQHVDRFGIDSEHDYDPVWREFVQLGVAVTSHGAVGLRYLDCGRRSPTSYVFNHIGGHAFQQGELCKSLVLGGVPRRFPGLRFAFLEGGAGWACDLLHALEEHWEKRSAAGLERYDPRRLDGAALAGLLEQAGLGGRFESRPPRSEPKASEGSGLGGRTRSRDAAPRRAGPAPWVRDEFGDAGIAQEDDLAAIFRDQFYFGCEADDRGIYRALEGRGNAFGLRLNAIFSSDIGHWDVPDLSRVLLESRRLVDAGLLDDADYRDFVFALPSRLHTSMNPAFFEGTRVEGAVTRSGG